jgi:hypothetical protein
LKIPYKHHKNPVKEKKFHKRHKNERYDNLREKDEHRIRFSLIDEIEHNAQKYNYTQNNHMCPEGLSFIPFHLNHRLSFFKYWFCFAPAHAERLNYAINLKAQISAKEQEEPKTEFRMK